MPEVSILITNYNYGKYLGRCLRSVLTQTFPRKSYEIVLVDDASSDDSKNIYNIFDRDLTIIENSENLGLSSSLNRGLSKCRGRFIVRVDADDYIHAEMLSFLYTGHELLRNEFHAVSCDYFEVDESGKNYVFKSSATEPIACGVMFTEEVFQTLGFYNDKVRVGEDIDLMNRFMKANLRLYNINLPLYRYVNHGISLSKGIYR